MAKFERSNFSMLTEILAVLFHSYQMKMSIIFSFHLLQKENKNINFCFQGILVLITVHSEVRFFLSACEFVIVSYDDFYIEFRLEIQ